MQPPPNGGQPYNDINPASVISWTVPSNCFVTNGNLTIRTKRQDYTPPGQPLRHWTGANMSSSIKFRYGYIEGRIKVPPQQSYLELFGYAFGQVQKRDAVWPAFWLQQPSPYSPNYYQEIDIFEFFGTSREFIFSVYAGNANSSSIPQKTHVPYTHIDASTDFHKYAIKWTPTQISMFWDDALVGTIPTAQNQTAMSIILNSLLRFR